MAAIFLRRNPRAPRLMVALAVAGSCAAGKLMVGTADMVAE